jgi:hypothetical protein
MASLSPRRINLHPALMFLVTGFPRWSAAMPSFCFVPRCVSGTPRLILAVVNEPSLAYSLFDEDVVEFENVRLEKRAANIAATSPST